MPKIERGESMNVRNLYPCQFEELREEIFYSLTSEHLEDVGADTSKWLAADWAEWYNGRPISDELVVKSFDGYDFHCDDFFCTSGKYDKYPDREDVTNNDGL